METPCQTTKVEQTDLDEMGLVLRFPTKEERSALRAVETPVKKGTSPNKGHSATGRTREYLEAHEMEMLLDRAKKSGRNAWRNYTLILMGFRHGLRVSEIADLQWADINYAEGCIHVRRLKGSKSTVQPMAGDEIRALKRLQRESPQSPWVFVGSDGKPLASSAIAAMFKRLGQGLFAFPIHVHMLRHSCGHALAMKGVDTRTLQDYLGHRNIMHTVRYTELSPVRFKGLWD